MTGQTGCTNDMVAWTCYIGVPYGTYLWQVGGNHMKPTLDRHEIIIAHNAGHDALFVCVPQNKVSFSALGWNPMNQNVL